jgi:type II secretory pathway pseudopilin PulG
MTLLEMLIVIALLASLSGVVISLVDNLDTRSRHAETVERLAAVRSAVLGPDAIASDGSFLTGGYLQDVGWLPAAAGDLVDDPPDAVASRRYSATWRTWHGWGGPYATAPPMRTNDTEPTLYDAWGAEFVGWPDATPWAKPLVSGDFAIQSLGADAQPGGTDPADDDWPRPAQPLVPETDWVTDLTAWSIRIVNETSTDFSAAPVTVRLKVVVPRWDASGGAEPPLDYWPASAADRDAWEHYGAASFSLNVAAKTDASNADAMTVTFGDGTAPRRIPNGRRMLFLVDETTGRPVRPNAWAELRLSRRLAPPPEVVLEIRD